MRSLFRKFVPTLFILISGLNASATVAFFGRDYETYKDMFCLNDNQLQDQTILDTPSGPSTFLGTLKEKGWLKPGSFGVDLAYADIETMKKLIDHGMRMSFIPYFDGTFRNWPAAFQTRFVEKFNHFNQVHDQFLAYYQKYPEIFLKGDIQKLEETVKPNAFDLILSSNLLFLYSGETEINEEFHRNAILSMIRVLKSNGEIRIFPLEDLEAKFPPFLDHLIAELKLQPIELQRTNGCAPSVGHLIKRQYEARGQMLIIRKKATNSG
jgi:hypothetical protein